MIKYMEEPADLLPIAALEPALGCQIMSWAIAYHGDPFTADIWLVCSGGVPIGAVGALGGSIYVLAQNAGVTSELMNFVMMLSASDPKGLFCGGRFSLAVNGLPGFTCQEQPVLKCSQPAGSSAGFTVEEPRVLTDCWDLLAAESPSLAGSDKESWLLRTSRGIRRRQTTVLMIYDGEKPAATASIRGRTEEAGLITNVATLPEFRRRGFAGALTASLVNRLLAEERSAYIIPSGRDSLRLYTELGFAPDYTQFYYKISGDGR